jgi:hypothetical protein
VRERLTNGQAERDMELRYRIVTVDLDTMACTVNDGDDPTALHHTTVHYCKTTTAPVSPRNKQVLSSHCYHGWPSALGSFSARFHH